VILREPDWQRGNVRLWLGDCLEILPEIPAGTVDAVVTDPPFGIRFDRATWDDNPSAYPALMSVLVSECQHIIQVGRVFVFQAMLQCGQFHSWFPAGWRIFAACKNFAQIRPTGVWHSWDPVVFWENGKPSPSLDVVNRDYHVGNVAGMFGDGVEHPCPKPLDTMLQIVRIAAEPGGTILDPFMGSGTTGVACVKLGRAFMGIEIEPKYFEIAVRRISEAMDDRENDLFHQQEQPNPIQEKLFEDAAD